MSAQNVFGENSERQEVATNHILHVTITRVLYPDTKKVLHQVFDPYGGEKEVLMTVFERIDRGNIFMYFNQVCDSLIFFLSFLLLDRNGQY
jgi:hypothetical protein